jgi:hypothetical protein
MKQPGRDRNNSDENLSNTILAVLARTHPTRLTRADVVNEVLKDLDNAEKQRDALSKRLGRLISSGAIEEKLGLNESAERVGLSGRSLVGISLNIEVLRAERKSQHDVIDEILRETSAWVEQRWGKDSGDFRPVPPVVIRDVNIVHGSDQFDLILTILHSKDNIYRVDRSEREDIVYYYVREVIQSKVSGVRGTRTMGIASSRAHPLKPTAREAETEPASK